jgi:hypothetical protein
MPPSLDPISRIVDHKLGPTFDTPSPLIAVFVKALISCRYGGGPWGAHEYNTPNIVVELAIEERPSLFAGVQATFARLFR